MKFVLQGAEVESSMLLQLSSGIACSARVFLSYSLLG